MARKNNQTKARNKTTTAKPVQAEAAKNKPAKSKAIAPEKVLETNEAMVSRVKKELLKTVIVAIIAFAAGIGISQLIKF